MTTLPCSFLVARFSRLYLGTGATALLCLLLLISSTTIADSQEVEPLEVVAIEYPPLLGAELEGYGTLFVLMEEYASAHFKTDIVPDFLPPARAQRKVYEGQWCLTFYPPQKEHTDSFFVPLENGAVKIGLFRKRHPSLSQPFVWNELEELRGKSVAILRSNIETKFYNDIAKAGLEIVHVETREQGIQLLLSGRIDYAQGDNRALEYLADGDANKIEFSQTYLVESNIGFHYRLSCAEKIFKEGHIPHLATSPKQEILVQ
jgi:polar amino acid transport system substrate-binding protein